MRYSKKVREEAAQICAIAASTPDLAECYGTIADLLDIDQVKIGSVFHTAESEDLAFYAWQKTQHAECPDAEAESLIRCGWSPGDES